MDAVQAHLILNHFPIVGGVFALILFSLGLVLRSDSLKKAALTLTLLVAVTAVPAFLSGEGAEELLEGKYGITEKMIEAHEDAIKPGLIVQLIAAAAAAFSLIIMLFKRANAFRTGIWVTFTLLLVGTGLLARGAHFGGLIRHEELRGEEPTAVTVEEIPLSEPSETEKAPETL